MADKKSPVFLERAVDFLHKNANSRVDSGIQDRFGAEVAGRYLEDHPLKAKTPEDNLQPVAIMADFACRNPTANDLVQKFHVPLPMRFNSAIFANDRLRKVMNCSPSVPAKQICNVSIESFTDIRPAASGGNSGSGHGGAAGGDTTK